MKKPIKLVAIVLSLFITAISTKDVMAQIPIQNSDAAILGVVSVIDQSEIQMAQMAEQKNIDRHVLDYARMLERDHKKNLDQVRKLSQECGIMIDENNSSIAQLRTDGAQDMSTLAPLDQNDFSREFISDMIKGHSDVLRWIDSQNTQNERVKRFLEETRKYIAKHLKKAQDIQDHVLR